jgi:hypothetical protein
MTTTNLQKSRAGWSPGRKDEEKISMPQDKKIEIVADDSTNDIAGDAVENTATPAETAAPTETATPAIPPETLQQLDEEETEFRAIRRDLPGVKGSSAAGIVAISVGKTPTKNEFFRVHPQFRPVIPLVDHEVGLEKQFFAVAADMVAPLASIGITVSDHVLYLTVTSRGWHLGRWITSARSF